MKALLKESPPFSLLLNQICVFLSPLFHRNKITFQPPEIFLYTNVFLPLTKRFGTFCNTAR